MTADEFIDALASLTHRASTAPGVIDAFITGMSASMLTDAQRERIVAKVEEIYG